MSNMLIILVYWLMAGSLYALLAVMGYRAFRDRNAWYMRCRWLDGWIEHSKVAGTAKWPFFDGLGG